MGDILAQVERLTAERDEARANAERLWTTLAEQDNELEAARDDVLRLTAERDEAQANVKYLIDERHSHASLDSSRPTDEDIWREAFMSQLHDRYWAASEVADFALAEYRKRWPR